MRTTLPVPHSLLRWIFGHDGLALTCSVNPNGHGSFDVCVLPHWNLSASIVEPCRTAATAFERHAEIASYLRREGWVVMERAAS